MPSKDRKLTASYLSDDERRALKRRASQAGMSESEYIRQVLNGNIQSRGDLTIEADSNRAMEALAVREADTLRRYHKRGGYRWKPTPNTVMRGVMNYGRGYTTDMITHWLDDNRNEHGGLCLPWDWLRVAGKRIVTSASSPATIQSKVSGGMSWLTDYEPVTAAFDWIFGQEYGWAQIPTAIGGEMRPEPASVPEGGNAPKGTPVFRYKPGEPNTLFRLPPQPVGLDVEVSGGTWGAMDDEAKEIFFFNGLVKLVQEKVVSEVLYGNATPEVFWNYNVNLGAEAGTGENQFPGTDVDFGGTINRDTLLDATKMLNDVKTSRDRLLVCSTQLATMLERTPVAGAGSSNFIAQDGMAAGVPYVTTALVKEPSRAANYDSLNQAQKDEDDARVARESHVGMLVPTDHIVVVVWGDGVSFRMFSPPGENVIKLGFWIYVNTYIHHPSNVIRFRLGQA